MAKVDRTGTFRFNKVLEAGVHAKQDEKGEFKTVSFNVRLLLSEFYDVETGTWVDWSEYGMEVIAYLYLYGVSKKSKKLEPTLNHTQVMKVFGWDGDSFQSLANDDYSKTKGQVRIQDNDPEYADRNPFQVAFIDVYDADPSSQLRKLGDDDLKKLQAQFAGLLQSTGKTPKAATVPAKRTTKPKPPKAAKPKEEETIEPESEEEKKAKLKAKSDRLRGKEKPSTPPARKPVEQVPPQDTDQVESTKEYTKQQAWEVVVEMKDDKYDDEQLNTAWKAAIDQVAGSVRDEEVTGQQWGQISDIVLDEVGKF